MLILVCDTSNSTCCAGVYEIDGFGNRKELSYRISLEKKTHSDTFMPLVHEVMGEAGISHADLDAYAAVTGPGSFTGIRIGISSVKGMAAVSGKPCIPVSSTFALAKSLDVIDIPDNKKTLILACFDARNSRVFEGGYLLENGKVIQLIDEKACDSVNSVNEIKECCEKNEISRVIVAGSGAASVKNSFGDAPQSFTVEYAIGASILPKGIAGCCEQMLSSSNGCDDEKNKQKLLVCASELSPVYCALSSAQRNRNDETFSVEEMHVKVNKETINNEANCTADNESNNELMIEKVHEITALEAVCLKHPWASDDVKNLLVDDNKVAVGAYATNRTLAGYVGASFVLDEAEIGNVCVLSKYRRRGIASMVLAKLFEKLKSNGVKTVFLEVEDGNEPAIALYEKIGFVRYSTRRGYYGEGRDALLYKIAL